MFLYDRNLLDKEDTAILVKTENPKEFSRNSVTGCCLEVLIKNFGSVLETSEIIDFANVLYKDRTSKKFRDQTGRDIRKLYELGIIKRQKG